MAHHKRHRTKKQRAGCLMCKPHKMNGVRNSIKSQTIQEQREVLNEQEEVEEKEEELETGV